MKKAAKTTAVHQVNDIDMRTAVNATAALATFDPQRGTAIPGRRPRPGSGGCPTTTSCSTTTMSAGTMR